MTEEVEVVNFSTLNIEIPVIVKTYSMEKQREIYNYLSQLDNVNLIAYKIAFNHLETSFDICRTNGYIKWKQSNRTK